MNKLLEILLLDTVEHFEQEGTTPSNLSYCKAAALV